MTSTNYSYSKDKQNHVFSTFLKHLRQNNDLSQEQLCLHLRQHSSLFYNLDTITVSRWERGVNIPSLAKQAEIVELYDNELTSIYSRDKQFLKECSNLVAIPNAPEIKSSHPYYANDEYQIKNIDIEDDSFYLVLKMILRYEGNPSLKLKHPLEDFFWLKNVKISIAIAFNGQIVGHGLYLETSAQNFLELVNINSDLSEIVANCDKKDRDAMLVLSSAGATKQVENSIMSTYINQFSQQKYLRYLCFSICDEGFIKKLNTAKLEPFKARNMEFNDRMIAIHSFLLSRSELMANRFLLKLAVISPKRLVTFLGNDEQGGCS
ncbi:MULTISPECIES: helix-turn-helix domain-containing protein [unclassified Shewanella]|uniref:helix-turn-helix domain-containing protein n=1 Tax=unclassified Shewanella TaxID=196818 RepID=UPI0018E2FBCF|nr:MULTISPECIES: helix-turn-helix transcriptional regulator [unclassified Shewanella]